MPPPIMIASYSPSLARGLPSSSCCALIHIPIICFAILFLSGVILFTIGIVGVYLGRIYEQLRGRPRYIVDDKIGFDEARKAKSA